MHQHLVRVLIYWSHCSSPSAPAPAPHGLTPSFLLAGVLRPMRPVHPGMLSQNSSRSSSPPPSSTSTPSGSGALDSILQIFLSPLPLTLSLVYYLQVSSFNMRVFWGEGCRGSNPGPHCSTSELYLPSPLNILWSLFFYCIHHPVCVLPPHGGEGQPRLPGRHCWAWHGHMDCRCGWCGHTLALRLGRQPPLQQPP